ncbi:ubiquitin carboxyl-terminal hydrolase isozyme L4-like isoform X1 [Petromyzon marinus]|uniref:ubiquitin carboxyl-terminal hydrolase isozyme L4-like isoform X1 n=1 Tax=Petromyzon marinus TaxID=7757 RepID=UPI003F702FDF
MSAQHQCLMPLEANPEVVNQLLTLLGVRGLVARDLLGLEGASLAAIPRPAHAIVLLLPRAAHDSGEGQVGAAISGDVYHVTQPAQTLCGILGIVHALANIPRAALRLDSDSPFKKFLEETKSLSPAERGERLHSDTAISKAHLACANQGQSQVPGEPSSVDLHYVALVCVGDGLYELDGWKATPVHHGPSSAASVLEDAARVCRSLVSRAPGDLRFSALVLCEETAA